MAWVHSTGPETMLLLLFVYSARAGLRRGRYARVYISGWEGANRSRRKFNDKVRV